MKKTKAMAPKINPSVCSASGGWTTTPCRGLSD